MDSTKFEVAVQAIRSLCLDLLVEKEDFIDVEQASFRMALDILTQGLGQALSDFDDRLHKSGSIKGVVKAKEKRSVLSLCGEVKFCRRRYKTKDSSHLPLDEILALSPKTRLSPASLWWVSTLALTSSYQKAADEFERITNVSISKVAVGEALVTTARLLKGSFDGSERAALSRLCVEADGIWVALQHSKASRLKAAAQGLRLPCRQEVCLGLDYAGKQTDKYGVTHRINPAYYVSLEGHQDFWAGYTQSIDARYRQVKVTLFSSDGEAGYTAGKDLLPGKVIHLYDRWHVFRRVRDLTEPDSAPEIISCLCAKRMDAALLHLSGYRDFYQETNQYKQAKMTQKLMKFLIRWQKEILAGLSYSLGSCEGANAHVIAARCKTLGRSWSPRRLGAITALLAHTHSKGEIPKLRRSFPCVLAPPPKTLPQEIPTCSKDANTKESQKQCGYYHEARFSDEWVASRVHSWQDDLRMI